MKKPIAAASVLATVLFAAACGPQGGHVDLSNARMVKGSSPIVGGTADSGHPKVVLIYNQNPATNSGYLCTGTVIGPSVILTAGHCTYDDATASHYTVYGGSNIATSGFYDWTADVTAVHTDPNYDPTAFGVGDVGILILDRIAPTGAMAWASTDTGDIVPNATFTAVGFGITGANQTNDTSGDKRTVQLTINQVGADAFDFGDSTHNTCSGDSGGPAILNIAGTDTIIGIVSYGDQNCQQYGVDVRTDYGPISTFIGTYADVTVTPTPTPGSTPTPSPTATPGTNNAKGDDSPFKSFGCDVAGLDASAGGALSMLLGAALALARRKRS